LAFFLSAGAKNGRLLRYWNRDKCTRGKGYMKKHDEVAAKITKEIIIKLIEVGRLSLSSFDEAWKQVFETVRGSINIDGD